MSEVDEYLTDLMSRLCVSRRDRARIESEIRDHLHEATASRVRAGTPTGSAAQQAIASFGTPALLAGQFNAAAGRRAVRRTPLIVFATGTAVVAGFLIAATTQPGGASPAEPVSQISFFGAVLAMQIAVVAGACASARTAVLWRSPVVGVASKVYVRRCATLSIGALLVAAVGWTVTFVVDFVTSAGPNEVTLAIGAAAMIVAATAGCALLAAMPVSDTDESTGAGAPPQACWRSATPSSESCNVTPSRRARRPPSSLQRRR
jgi:hypothetical protein